MTGCRSYGSIISDKRKSEFFLAMAVVCLHQLYSNETLGEKAKWEILENVTCCFEQIPEVAMHKTATCALFYKPLQ